MSSNCPRGNRGLLVVFVGPDGTGKTTLVREMSRALAARGLRPYVITLGGYLAPLLPTTRLLAARARVARAEASLPEAGAKKRHPPSPIVRWVQELTLLNYLLEFFAKYAFVIRPLLRRYDVVLADRYGYDFLIIPRRLTRLEWFNRGVCRAMPAPDVGYVLDGEPSVLHQRKGENSLDEATRQREIFAQLCRWVPTLTALRAGETLERLVETVDGHISAALERSGKLVERSS